MKILVVDDERIMLAGLVSCIKRIQEDAEIFDFQASEEALEFCQEHPVDVAFLDIRMPGMDGMELGKRLLHIMPELNLIYCTAYDDYISDAFRKIRCNGYIIKPAMEEDVREELNHLRLPYKMEKKLLTVKCFGTFDVFHEGKSLSFARNKTKELFAFLVDRKGATVNGNMICAALYENGSNEENNKSDLRKLVADLRVILRNIGAEDVFIKGFNSYSIDTNLIDCDYYQWEKEDEKESKLFQGEYMSQYSWAEKTLGRLVVKRNG